MLTQIALAAASWLMIPLAWLPGQGGQRRISDRLGSAVTYMAIFVGAIIWITMPLLEQPRFIGSLRIGLGVAGAVFTATGVMLWVWGGRTLVPSTGWGEDNNPKYLVTEGPYKLMRHPVYVGVVSLMVGWILLTGAVYSFLLCPIFYLLLCFEAYLEEERALRPRFENRVVVQLCK